MPKRPKRLTRKEKIATNAAVRRVEELARLKEKSEAIRAVPTAKGALDER